jgi:hypothetical protein
MIMMVVVIVTVMVVVMVAVTVIVMVMGFTFSLFCGHLIRGNFLKFGVGQAFPLRVGQDHLKIRGLEAALINRGSLEAIAGERKLPQFLLQHGQVQPQIKQRADHHIAADTGKAVKIENFSVGHKT